MKGGAKKVGRKAAAEAAAHSAGRRKASAVELTADNEARVRSALAVRWLLVILS